MCSSIVWFGLVSLFNGISTLFRLFNAEAILLEEQEWYYLTHSWEDKGVHTFPKGICPRVNVIARLEYKLMYYDSAVHHFNHYTTRTSPSSIVVSMDVHNSYIYICVWVCVWLGSSHSFKHVSLNNKDKFCLIYLRSLQVF